MPAAYEPKNKGHWLVLALLVADGGCGGNDDVIRLAEANEVLVSTTTVEDELSPRSLRRFAPADAPLGKTSKELVDLGRMLYFETRLSRTGTIACNSCHPLERYGTTDTAVSVGVDGRRGSRNAPSTYYSTGHFRQFWDGRAATAEEQVGEPIGNGAEMDMPLGDEVQGLERVDGYAKLFERAFPGETPAISLPHVGSALAAFEAGLVTPSRWDRYLRGDASALTHREKEGAKLFANLGCSSCHNGAYLGGSMFAHVGVHEPWPTQNDKGRSRVSSSNADDMVFKVPSLRNVARTAPYFHDGSVASLDVAVRMMAKHQLGIELDDNEAGAITTWLGSLTGDIPTEYVRAPVLPAVRRP